MRLKLLSARACVCVCVKKTKWYCLCKQCREEQQKLKCSLISYDDQCNISKRFITKNAKYLKHFYVYLHFNCVASDFFSRALNCVNTTKMGGKVSHFLCVKPITFKKYTCKWFSAHKWFKSFPWTIVRIFQQISCSVSLTPTHTDTHTQCPPNLFFFLLFPFFSLIPLAGIHKAAHFSISLQWLGECRWPVCSHSVVGRGKSLFSALTRSQIALSVWDLNANSPVPNRHKPACLLQTACLRMRGEKERSGPGGQYGGSP